MTTFDQYLSEASEPALFKWTEHEAMTKSGHANEVMIQPELRYYLDPDLYICVRVWREGEKKVKTISIYFERSSEKFAGSGDYGDSPVSTGTMPPESIHRYIKARINKLINEWNYDLGGHPELHLHVYSFPSLIMVNSMLDKLDSLPMDHGDVTHI